MKIIFIKVLVGILFGVAFGLISVPLSKKLILSRSEDPGDVIVLRKKSTYILTALAGAVSAVGFILTADDETEFGASAPYVGYRNSRFVNS